MEDVMTEVSKGSFDQIIRNLIKADEANKKARAALLLERDSIMARLADIAAEISALDTPTSDRTAFSGLFEKYFIETRKQMIKAGDISGD